MHLKSIVIFLFCAFISGTISAQGDKLIPSKKLNKDFEEMVAMIEAHPSPYRHISEANLNKLIDSTRNLINEPMSALHFYKLITPIFTSLKDGHTSVYYPQDWIKKLRKENGVFPYKVYITEENRLYIIGNYGADETIPLGAEILSLNGVTSSVFIKEISRYVSYEQEIFRNTIIEEDFDFYLLLYFGQLFDIELEYFSDKKHKHTVNYILYDKWVKGKKEDEKYETKKTNIHEPYEYKKVKEGVALLKIHSFAIRDHKKFEFFLNDMFRKINKEGIKSLIIDVRGNTGGYPKEVSHLLHYVSDKYFKTMARSEMKVSEAYKEYFKNIAPSVNFYSAHFSRRPHTIDVKSVFVKEPGTIVSEELLYNEPPKEMFHEFRGDLYLLIDRRSFSASSSFAATFRCYQLGAIIGSETGGTKVFHANSMFKELRHSRIIGKMATTRLYTPCFYEEDEGIKPDLVVKPTIQTLVAKSDIVLNHTLRVINKIQKLREEEKK
ncbi:MAG: hypothetical protein DWQ02_06850 [Bacteroidetes bacterium]|nr:MAG: hypothetical protein DWQ02_06850 [Bacteroidota bacterium]